MKIFTKILVSLLVCFSFASANNFMNPQMDNAQISVNNTVLAKVDSKAITALDIKKKLDIAFERSFSDLVDSNSARFQFYQTGWKQILDEVINNELILADAEKREFKITDAELSEEMENRFGPNIMSNLQKFNLSYEDAQKMLSEEMIIQRMMYYFVKAKADQVVTPVAIRNSYRLYIKENPAKQILSYHVISIRCDDKALAKKFAEKAHTLLKEKNIDPKDLENDLKDLEKSYKNSSISVSNLYKLDSKDIAISQRKVLLELEKNTYSGISSQVSRINNKEVHRIFYLKDTENIETKTFDEMAQELKNNLMEKHMLQEAEKYFAKLKTQYHVEKFYINSNEFIPFSLR
ncbi:MAG: Chaperone SurA [Candidatus Anoxychlamydiales bacterium]|nr:Chaperone SurA [Candidatus Anoxychlamydiales bacterium]